MSRRPSLSDGLLFAFLVVSLLRSVPSLAQGFPPISQEDLKMTSEPKAPGAPAVILFREVDRDDNGMTSHEDHYMRVKILTEKGRAQANIEIPFFKATQDVVNIHARTVQPNGTTADFNGKIMERTIAKTRGLKYLAKTLAIPDVQVGTIIEYRYTVDLREHLTFNSNWILSSNLFTREAKFSLKPYKSAYRPLTVRWTWQGIPEGTTPKEGPEHIVRLEVQNIPPFEEEDYMPPPNQLKARVDFIYEGEFMENDKDEFWRHVGKKRNEELESFVGRHKAMEEAVSQITSPSDSPQVNLRKLYERVQKLRNTTYEVAKAPKKKNVRMRSPQRMSKTCGSMVTATTRNSTGSFWLWPGPQASTLAGFGLQTGEITSLIPAPWRTAS